MPSFSLNFVMIYALEDYFCDILGRFCFLIHTIVYYEYTVV